MKSLYFNRGRKPYSLVFALIEEVLEEDPSILRQSLIDLPDENPLTVALLLRNPSLVLVRQHFHLTINGRNQSVYYAAMVDPITLKVHERLLHFNPIGSKYGSFTYSAELDESGEVLWEKGNVTYGFVAKLFELLKIGDNAQRILLTDELDTSGRPYEVGDSNINYAAA